MIGYLGPVNSFTYLASKKMNLGEELIPFESIQSLFLALKSNKVDGIVVPIENSTEGTINLTLDSLNNHNLFINKELTQEIKLALIANHSDLSKIKHVVSHSHALAQCRETLEKHIGSYKEIGTASTSKSIELLKELDDSYGVIASREAIQNNMIVLLDEVQDYRKNSTRFVYIKKEQNFSVDHNKTSIICIPHKNYPGLLYDILHEFAIRRINLSNIESRPNKNEPGNYNFYIDFDGNIEEELPKEALNILKHKIQVKILGSYKV